MSTVEVLNELKKIRGKFLKTEGIYVFSKPDLYVSSPLTVTTSPLESDVIDFSNFNGFKFFLFNNEEDVKIYVTIYAGLTPTGPFIPLRSNIPVEANNIAAAVGWIRFLYGKLKFQAEASPTSGTFNYLIARWSM